MIDKEAQEKIAEGMFQLVFLVDDIEIEQRWKSLQSSVKRQWQGKAESLIGLFEQLGYRKLPKDKPPLLSDEKILEIIKAVYGNDADYGAFDLITRSLKAQRETDIKWYETGVII